MKFFRQIEPVLEDGFDLTMVMRKVNNQITVTVLPAPTKNEVEEGKTQVSVSIKPLVLSGSAGELDQEFLQVITKVREKTTNIVNTIVGYQNHLDKQLEAKKDKNKKKSKAVPSQEDLFGKKKGCSS